MEHYGTVGLKISTNNQTWSAPFDFHFDSLIKVKSVSPNFGYDDLTTSVIVEVSHLYRLDNSGRLLHNISELFCKFGDLRVPIDGFYAHENETNYVYCRAPPQVDAEVGKTS